MHSGDALNRVQVLVDREAVRPGDKPHLVGRLQRLCRAATASLPATGVGVSMMSAEGGQVMVVASNPRHEAVEELQFTMGEGPCLDAFTSRGPVLTPDLAVAARARWPGYAPEVLERGVHAVFAFPMQVGAARLGALDVYRDRTGPLPSRTLAQAMTFAEAAMVTLLDAGRELRADDALDADVLEGRLELYQAQGMVMIQLGITLPEAMARLRGYAYAHNRRVGEVARDIVARRLVIDADDGCHPDE